MGGGGGGGARIRVQEIEASSQFTFGSNRFQGEAFTPVLNESNAFSGSDDPLQRVPSN